MTEKRTVEIVDDDVDESDVDDSDNEEIDENSSGNYVKDISSEAITVTKYCNYEFEFLYYHDNVFYYFTGLSYKKLHICEDKWENVFVNAHDTNEKPVRIFYNKFKHEYGLI
jgi:hypothetical protein